MSNSHIIAVPYKTRIIRLSVQRIISNSNIPACRNIVKTGFETNGGIFCSNCIGCKSLPAYRCIFKSSVVSMNGAISKGSIAVTGCIGISCTASDKSIGNSAANCIINPSAIQSNKCVVLIV